mmetsp:Transcript_12753/g.18614  ORF Transcript_12753/g.18614 Transcript_12753/m.18614 type:complete len:684 (+) Transcript_12753:1-2052(+)
MNFLNLINRKPDPSPQNKYTASIPNSDAELFTLSTSKQPIIALLKSNSDQDKLRGMKVITAMQITRKDTTPFLPYVINIVTKDFKLKKLIYFYLVNCCGVATNEILMSINSFHKELNDSKPLIRASALRALSSLQIEEIFPILMMAVQRAVSDFSIYVRRAAAYSLQKLIDWEEASKETLVQLLCKLLGDANPLVVGPAMLSFQSLCPERLDLLHSNFRRYCRLLEEVEQFFVPVVLHQLLRYSRTYLDQQLLNPQAKLDPDLKLFLDTCTELLHYDSPAVLSSVAQVFLVLDQTHYFQQVIPCLLSFQHQPQHQAYLLLCLLEEFANKVPDCFQPFYSYFFVCASDSRDIALKKLQILSSIATEANGNKIVKELGLYSRKESEEVSVVSITTIGKIAEKNQSLTETATKQLVTLLKSYSPLVTAQVIVVLRKLISQNPQKYRKVIVHCARVVENLQFPKAKASAVWIIGKFFSLIPTLAAEALRKLTLEFTKEQSPVKHQILNSAVKMFSEAPAPIKPKLNTILKHLLDLAFYDISYDIRDKGRVLSSVYLGGNLSFLENEFLFKDSGEVTTKDTKSSVFVPLSVSYLVGCKVSGYSRLWEDINDPEHLKATLETETSGLRDQETVPTIRVPESTHYSSEEVTRVAGTGLEVRLAVNNPEDLEAFFEASEESEYESEESEEN